MGESQTLEFHFCGELEPLNAVLDDILNTLFEQHVNFKQIIDETKSDIDYSFDKDKMMADMICWAVEIVVKKHEY